METVFDNVDNSYEEIRSHLTVLMEDNFQAHQILRAQDWYDPSDEHTGEQQHDGRVKLLVCAKLALNVSYSFLQSATGTLSAEQAGVDELELLQRFYKNSNNKVGTDGE